MKNGMRKIHPGEILREEFLRPYNVSAETLAHFLNIDLDVVDAILNEKQGLDAGIAQGLSVAFRTSLEFWLNLQKSYEAK